MTGRPASPFPWRRYRELGLGVLGWPPVMFWSATPCDVLAALNGWREVHGGGNGASGLSIADVAELKRKFAAARPAGGPIEPPTDRRNA